MTKTSKHAEQQRKKLVLCAIIMATYLILTLLIEPRSFWIFGSIHTVLAAGTILFILFGGKRKVSARVVMFLSGAGAGTALIFNALLFRYSY